MNKILATGKSDNSNEQPVSRYARVHGLVVTGINELLITLIAGFTGLGIYQFMLMLSVIPATCRW